MRSDNPGDPGYERFVNVRIIRCRNFFPAVCRILSSSPLGSSSSTTDNGKKSDDTECSHLQVSSLSSPPFPRMSWGWSWLPPSKKLLRSSDSATFTNYCTVSLMIQTPRSSHSLQQTVTPLSLRRLSLYQGVGVSCLLPAKLVPSYHDLQKQHTFHRATRLEPVYILNAHSQYSVALQF